MYFNLFSYFYISSFGATFIVGDITPASSSHGKLQILFIYVRTAFHMFLCCYHDIRRNYVCNAEIMVNKNVLCTLLYKINMN